MEEKIKEAFKKVKEDIFSLGNEVEKIKIGLADMKNELRIVTRFLQDLREKTPEKPLETLKTTPTHPTKTQTKQQIFPTHEEIPTDKLLSQVLKAQNTGISTGNQGVPTDKQTNRQTNRQIIQHIIPEKKPEETQEATETNHLDKAREILDSLDALKKEVRIKIKRLTEKEMQVLSLLYSLENQGQVVDYPLLASKLSLSESSVRDYIGRLKKKGIPVDKEKINNKKIILHISKDLKKIASLDTIIKLRGL